LKNHFGEEYVILCDEVVKEEDRIKGMVEMRLGSCLDALERDHGYFDCSISNLSKIVMTVIVHILMLIGNRKTPVKNLKILFSDAIGSNTSGQTSYKDEFKDVTITINPKLVAGPFDLIGTTLHEVAHLVSLPRPGHTIETFYKYYIWL